MRLSCLLPTRRRSWRRRTAQAEKTLPTGPPTTPPHSCTTGRNTTLTPSSSGSCQAPTRTPSLTSLSAATTSSPWPIFRTTKVQENYFFHLILHSIFSFHAFISSTYFCLLPFGFIFNLALRIALRIYSILSHHLLSVFLYRLFLHSFASLLASQYVYY